MKFLKMVDFRLSSIGRILFEFPNVSPLPPDFRPISCCNVLFKIITKVLAIRFQMKLENMLSDAQGAFIPGRLITDNMFAALRMLHSLKNKKRERKGFQALDMAKAYDRVE